MNVLLMLRRDDGYLEIFESKDDPPRRLEAIDIETEEYEFCDESGQRYAGVVTKPMGFLQGGAFELRPVGRPDLKNALELIDQAEGLEDNAWHPTLDSLRRALTRH